MYTLALRVDVTAERLIQAEYAGPRPLVIEGTDSVEVAFRIARPVLLADGDLLVRVEGDRLMVTWSPVDGAQYYSVNVGAIERSEDSSGQISERTYTTDGTEIKHIRRFRAESGLYTWLYRIMVNECRMFLRKRRPALLAETELLDADGDDAETFIQEQEERMTLVQSLRQLPYIYREALVLHYYFDMSIAEIAGSLGCSQSTVKSRLLRGRRQLGGLIQEVLCHGAL